MGRQIQQNGVKTIQRLEFVEKEEYGSNKRCKFSKTHGDYSGWRENIKFRHFLVLVGGDVLLDGAHFENVPREGITIATWIRLDTNKGIQSIFDTVGSHSRHRDGQYHFEIDNGKVRWFHRNENHDTIFSLLTRPVVREGIWTQLTATYNAQKQRARVSSEIYRPGVHDFLHGGEWI